MTKNYNEQEQFWAKEFGDEYIHRNAGEHMIDSNEVMFREIFDGVLFPTTALEIGSNIGQNIKALKRFIPKLQTTAVEINQTAVNIMTESGFVDSVFSGSFLEVEIPDYYELVFSKGVLIHISPSDLPATYRKMANLSTKYVLIAEYYNPSPVQIEYRGHANKLFKRDFAGEFLDAFSNYELVKTGFAYHRGKFPQDDLTWFLMRRLD